MVVNEKALKRCLKEAYKTRAFTVAVDDGRMMINGGYWLVIIDTDEVPNGILGLFGEWMRKIPDEGEAYRVIKGDEGAIIQKQLLTDALSQIREMEGKWSEAVSENPDAVMRRVDLRFEGAQIWQNSDDLSVLMVDHRYEAMLDSIKDIYRVGTGLYASGNVSTAWILGIDSRGSAKEKVDHLAKFRWVHK